MECLSYHNNTCDSHLWWPSCADGTLPVWLSWLFSVSMRASTEPDPSYGKRDHPLWCLWKRRSDDTQGAGRCHCPASPRLPISFSGTGKLNNDACFVSQEESFLCSTKGWEITSWRTGSQWKEHILSSNQMNSCHICLSYPSTVISSDIVCMYFNN